MTMSTVIVIRIPGLRLTREHCDALLSNVLGASDHRAHLCHAVDAPETYIYLADALDNTAPQEPTKTTSMIRPTDTLAAAIAQHYPNASTDLLQLTLDLRGQAWDKTATWHYVVETDVDATAEADFNDWYTQEHMPGLAAVPGTVRAMRLHNRDGAPRYHALYLLQAQDIFGSPQWLAVRGTEWSSRVRPHFKNTKRTMFNIIR
ncbi:DUF4286 family protein [Advenella sp. FME57]|uniref:ABM domain-containing protein n=1 Tax=Advenella kashmirensis TaxID=310575 RepID=A0A356LAN9_9BURK|nr:DUF4286 family protein [Advenella sp. FME57]HBP27889.1 hypothetical protein [Advenella kashmirensis]